MTAFDVEALRRREYPWIAQTNTTYLNSASTGPLPERTLAELERFNRLRAEPHRISQDEQFGVLTKSRALLASLLNVTAGEIAVMTNTGHGINLAARSLGLQAGDVVLGFDREFPANVYPWMALSSQGIEFRMIPCVAELPDEARLLEELEGDERVKVVAVSWVQFATGYTVDIHSLGTACRDRGVHLVIDGIQGLGPRTLDLSHGLVSMFACGGQKWLLSPWGSGFVHVRRDLIDVMQPAEVSWLGVRDSDDFSRLVEYDMTWRPDARRFEMVTLPFQDFAGMNASLGLLHELGPAAIEQHVRDLTDRIVDWACSESRVRLVTPPDPAKRAGIVAVAPPDAAEASRRLEASGVVHSLREGAIRLAPHCFNTIEEIDRAIALMLA